jgi:hypothetical protein
VLGGPERPDKIASSKLQTLTLTVCSTLVQKIKIQRETKRSMSFYFCNPDRVISTRKTKAKSNSYDDIWSAGTFKPLTDLPKVVIFYRSTVRLCSSPTQVKLFLLHSCCCTRNRFSAAWQREKLTAAESTLCFCLLSIQ